MNSTRSGRERKLYCAVVLDACSRRVVDRSIDGHPPAFFEQGVGKVGWHAAESFVQRGARIVALSDSTGGIANEAGLDLEAVAAHKRDEGTVVGTPGTLTISQDDLLTRDCDILVPAALGEVISEENSNRILAKVIVEAANEPVTPGADEILRDRGIDVVPDILANAGGVCVSHFEWVQNLNNQVWEEDVVFDRLRTTLARATDKVLDVRERLRSGPTEPPTTPDYRTAALVAAVERVARVTLKRGIWP